MKLPYVLTVLLFLAGCANYKPVTKSTDQLIKNNTGVIYAEAPSFFKGILPIADAVGIKITSVDGKKLSEDQNPWEIEVSAGDHEIEYRCYGTQNRGMITIRINEEGSFLIHVKPGFTYLTRLEFNSYGCSVDFKVLDSAES